MKSAYERMRPILPFFLLLFAGCGNFSFFSALGDKIDPLVISPATASLNVNGSMTFIASGGVAPYTFSISSAGSGSPTVNAQTGAYTAGSIVNTTDVVQVTDAASVAATATVTVSSAVTNVDYTVSAANFPTTGTASAAIPAGFGFTLQNAGIAAGTKTVDWWIFLSSTATLGSGARMTANGTNAALAAAGTVEIPLSGTWPAVTGTQYLIVLIAAADDLNAANNIYSAAQSITLAPPSVDYTVTAVTNTGGTVAGNNLSGSFTLQNSGSANGAQQVAWSAYASTDTNLTAADTLLASGTTSALAGGATQGVTFTGRWPATAGTWYLIVGISAGDDTVATNNTAYSAVTIAVSVNVDYTVVPAEIIDTGAPPATAGGPLGGNFTLRNVSLAAGTQTVAWTVYASLGNNTLDPVDTVVDSDISANLGANGSQLVPFSGTWPTASGNYYYIVQVAAPDDTVSTNNVTASASTVTVSAVDIDYAVSAVTFTGAGQQLPAGPADANFTLQNIGTANGVFDVKYSAFASFDTTLGSTDILLFTGQTPALSTTVSVVLSFTGVWPLDYGDYYIIVVATADDDANPGNNSNYTAGTTAVGFITAPAGAHSDVAAFSDAFNTGITFQPGMSVQVKGNIQITDTDYVMQFNTGSATTLTFSMVWSSNQNITLRVMQLVPPGTVVGSPAVTTASSVVLVWPRDAAGVPRYLDIENTTLANIGAYTLIITAN